MQVKTKSRSRRALTVIVIASLGGALIGRGVWALFQPWGVTSQKLFALGFFIVCFPVIFYQLTIDWLEPGSLIRTEKFQNFVYAVASFAFCVAGVFLLIFRRQPQKLWPIVGIIFFGICTVWFVRRMYVK